MLLQVETRLETPLAVPGQGQDQQRKCDPEKWECPSDLNFLQCYVVLCEDLVINSCWNMDQALSAIIWANDWLLLGHIPAPTPTLSLLPPSASH